MKNIFRISAVFSFYVMLFIPSVLASTQPFPAEKKFKTDVVLLAVPFAVKSPEPGRVVDALERPPEAMGDRWKIVLFRVERVLKGKYKIIKSKDPSLWTQVKDATEDKKILKLVTMDFQRPDEEEKQKEFLSMAVTDPQVTFGIPEHGEIPRQRYKISLARVSQNPENYILVHSKKA